MRENEKKKIKLVYIQSDSRGNWKTSWMLVKQFSVKKKRSLITIGPVDKEQGVMAVLKSHTEVPEIMIFNEKFLDNSRLKRG